MRRFQKLASTFWAKIGDHDMLPVYHVKRPFQGQAIHYQGNLVPFNNSNENNNRREKHLQKRKNKHVSSGRKTKCAVM